MFVRAHLGWFALLLSIAMTARGAHATLVLPQNIEALEAQSQLVFVGVCTSRTTVIDARGLAVDVYIFRIAEPVKGMLRKDGIVEIRQYAGAMAGPDGPPRRATGLPSYRVGQELLLFMSPPSRWGLTSPVGFSQGVFEVLREPGRPPHIALDPARRRMLLQGVDGARYAGLSSLTPEERQLIDAMPGQVDLGVFCSLVRHISMERTKSEAGTR